MVRGKGLFFSSRKTEIKKQKEEWFLENGSMLLEEVITSFNGKCNPIRTFSAEQVISATTKFDPQLLLMEDCDFDVYKGNLEEEGRQILVKRHKYGIRDKSSAIRDIAVTCQMSSHKNVLKLLGCCLELEFPALVYEYAGDGFLSDFLDYRNKEGVIGGVGHSNARSISWKSRLRVANQIANALVYLHTALPRPIVHRDVKPKTFVLDQQGVVKWMDFSLSISIPERETQVEDTVCGSFWFVDPGYLRTGFATVKSDVYRFGVLLCLLLTGRWPVDPSLPIPNIIRYITENAERSNLLEEIMDPRILREGAGMEQERQQQQLQAFLALALRCVQQNGEDRPESIDVAKELRRIEEWSARP